MPIISIEEVWHFYARGTPAETASLSGVSLEVQKGELLALVGATGSGKSTVLQLLNGLILPCRGRVLVDGFDTRDKRARKTLWMKVGLTMQYPEKQFFEETVFREVSFGPRNQGLPPAEIDRRVEEALALAGIDDPDLYRLSPFQLSGGLQRRVALASVLALKTGILALDEPTAGVDPGGRKKILETLKWLKNERGITIIMAGHNMEELAAVADRVAVLCRGRVALAGRTREVFAGIKALKEAGLEPPLPCEVINRLNKAGFCFDSTPLSGDEAAEMIYNNIKKRNPESRIG